MKLIAIDSCNNISDFYVLVNICEEKKIEVAKKIIVIATYKVNAPTD